MVSAQTPPTIVEPAPQTHVPFSHARPRVHIGAHVAPPLALLEAAVLAVALVADAVVVVVVVDPDPDPELATPLVLVVASFVEPLVAIDAFAAEAPPAPAPMESPLAPVMLLHAVHAVSAAIHSILRIATSRTRP